MSEAATESSKGKLNGIGPPLDGHKRQFSNEFKASVAARVLKKGEKAVAVAEELRISGSVIRRWVRDAKSGAVPRAGAVKGVSIGAHGRKAYSDDFQNRAVKRLKAESANKIADDLGIHTSMLYNWARKRGVKTPNPPRIGKGVDKVSDELKRKIVAQYRDGANATELAAKHKIKTGRIYYWAAQLESQPEPAPGASRKGVTPGSGISAACAAAVISFLTHARTAANAMLANGDIKELDEAHLLSQIALKRLLKEREG